MFYIIKNENENYKNDWEKVRFSSLVTAQCNSSKQLKPTDILKFTWDSEGESEILKCTENKKQDLERINEFLQKIS